MNCQTVRLTDDTWGRRWFCNTNQLEIHSGALLWLPGQWWEVVRGVQEALRGEESRSEKGHRLEKGVNWTWLRSHWTLICIGSIANWAATAVVLDCTVIVRFSLCSVPQSESHTHSFGIGLLEHGLNWIAPDRPNALQQIADWWSRAAVNYWGSQKDAC